MLFLFTCCCLPKKAPQSTSSLSSYLVQSTNPSFTMGHEIEIFCKDQINDFLLACDMSMDPLLGTAPALITQDKILKHWIDLYLSTRDELKLLIKDHKNPEICLAFLVAQYSTCTPESQKVYKPLIVALVSFTKYDEDILVRLLAMYCKTRFLFIKELDETLIIDLNDKAAEHWPAIEKLLTKYTTNQFDEDFIATSKDITHPTQSTVYPLVIEPSITLKPIF